jgi:hypothetical protein
MDENGNPKKTSLNWQILRRDGWTTKFDKELFWKLIDRPVCAARSHPA